MPQQHIIIVGGSSGIGLAAAHHLLGQGHRVTITGRDAARLELAQKKLSGALSTKIMDATDANGLPEDFARMGYFDHLILALGSRKGIGQFPSVSLAEVRASFEEKFYAHFGAAQAALPYVRKDGSFIFVAAVSAHAAMPGTAGIGAANAAVAALVPTLASELKPLRVNGVSPGVINTPWWDFLSGEQRDAVFTEYAGKSPVGRVGQPEDVAQAIAFLIADTFMTGQIIVCDGGLRLGA